MSQSACLFSKTRLSRRFGRHRFVWSESLPLSDAARALSRINQGVGRRLDGADRARGEAAAAGHGHRKATRTPPGFGAGRAAERTLIAQRVPSLHSCQRFISITRRHILFKHAFYVISIISRTQNSDTPRAPICIFHSRGLRRHGPGTRPGARRGAGGAARREDAALHHVRRLRQGRRVAELARGTTIGVFRGPLLEAPSL